MKNSIFKNAIICVCVLYVGVVEVSMAEESALDNRPDEGFIYPDLTTYFVCVLKRGPNWTAESTPEHRLLQSRHMAFLQELMLRGKILVAGPFTGDNDERGIAVFQTDSIDEAKSLFASDPKVRAGHLILEWHTWLVPKDLLPERTYVNKIETDRMLRFEAELDVPVSEAFLLWSTGDGVRKFFAPDAKIDPVFGGRYEIIFEPETDPEGKRKGTHGARILQYEKDKTLVFEWTMPPFAAELNTTPLPTWVELNFEAAGSNGNKTRISMDHHGFGHGENWDEAFDFFKDRAWPSVMSRLKEYCNEKKDPWN